MGAATTESAPLTAWGSATSPVTPESQSSRTDRYGELDIHRGIAVLAIVVYHVYQFSNINHGLYQGTPGYTILNSLDAAVPWFFVLSAFLLFEPIARSVIEGREPTSARSFLARRAVRLLPVYIVAITVVWFLRQQTLPGDWRDLLEHLTFTQVFDDKRIFYTNGPTWSVSVAVYFYLALTGITVALARSCSRIQSRSRRITLIGITAATLASAALAWKAWSFGVGHRPTTGAFTTWFGPLASLDNFAVGMGLALLVAATGNRRPLSPKSRGWTRIGAVGVLVLAFVCRQPNTWPAVYFSTEVSVGFGLLIAAAVLGPPSNIVSHALRWRPLRWLGLISFSVYLWHEPLMLALRGHPGLVSQTPGDFLPNVLAVIAASVAIGWISYTLIEKPTSQLRGIFRRDGHLNPDPLNQNSSPIEWETFRTGNPL